MAGEDWIIADLRRFREAVQEQRAAQTGAQISLSEVAPDVMAEGVRIGHVIGVPSQVVAQEPDGYRRQLLREQITRALRDAPRTQAFLNDPIAATLAQDDVSNLTWFERNFGAGGLAIGRGVRRLSAIPHYFSALENMTRTADVGRTFDDILAEEVARWGEGVTFEDLPASARVNALQVARLRYDAIAGQGDTERIEYIQRGAERLVRAQEILRITQNIPMSGAAAAFRDGPLAHAANTPMGVLSAFVRNPVDGAAFIAETAAETLPVLIAATVTTAATRAPAAGLAVMAGGSFLSENTNAAIQFLQERDVDMSTPEAAARVLQDQDLMAEAQEHGVTRGVIIAVFDALSGGVAGRALLESPVGDMVVQGIAQAALGAGGEATAQLATEDALDWRDIVVEGLAELSTTPIDVIGISGRGLLGTVAQRAEAGQTAARLVEIEEAAAESRLRERVPEMFEGALEAQGLGEQTIFVPADALREYFQDQGDGLRDERLAIWGLDPAVVEDAALAGTDIAIPLSTFATHIANTEDATWVRAHAVASPDEMSVAEAAEFDARLRDTMAEEFENVARARDDAEAARAADVQIYDQAFAQLRTAGRSPTVAQHEATVWSAFWRTMGERYGADPLDLARSMDVAVRGPLSEDAPIVPVDGQAAPDAGGGTSRSQSNSASSRSSSQTDPQPSQEGAIAPAPAENTPDDPATTAPGSDVQQATEEGATSESDLQDTTDTGKTLSQPGKRGSITLPAGGLTEGQTVISLFEGADLSTFLHESGHFFLEAFGTLAAKDNAPQAMKEDLAVILKWFGVDSMADLTTEHHEKWARGFEAYLMEGKAPSLGLADAFARFKAWLTRIYRTVRRLNVKLSKDVREVMDRMLATEAEIADARAEMSMRPLFAQAPPGMSEQTFATYRRLAQRATDGAEQALLDKTMASVRREKEAWYKQEKRAIRAEVTAETDRQPRYRLIEMLANQRWYGADGEVRDVPDTRIDRDMLVEQFGEEVLAGLSRTRFGGRRAIYGNDGSSPQEVAEFFGFRSALEMVDVLQNTPKKRAAIDTETDRRMIARYGDPIQDGSIEEEALAAVHAEGQMTLTVSEARHLATELGRPTRAMTVRHYRAQAREMIGRMSVREATRPERFLAAERKAARQAQDAFAKIAKGRGEGALATALQAKERQILNGFLYNEARTVAAEVQKGRERMRRYTKPSIRKKLNGKYIDQIDALLDGYDFRVRSARQVARTESLRDFVDKMVEAGRENELAIDARLMDEAHRKHYSRLSVDELHGLFDTIDNIDHMGRFKQKLINAQRKRDLDETVSAVVGAMNTNLKDNPPNRTETRKEKVLGAGRAFLNLTLNADTLLREMDGFADLGPSWKAFKEDIDSGMARLIERREAMAKELDRIYSVYSTKEKRDMTVKRAILELDGLYSKWDLIAIALNTGNETNYARLTNPRTKGGFTPEQVETALTRLDARDWEMVQSMWDYIGSFWPEISEKERRTTGVTPKKVDAKAMVETPIDIRGGYYPIQYDARLSQRITEYEHKDLMDRMRAGSYGKAHTRNGHTKERQENVTLPLRLDLGVAHAHLANVIYDLEIGEPINNAHRILQDTRVRDTFRQKGKQGDYEALELWLQDTAAGDQVRAEFWQSAVRHMRSGFVISRLALNLSTALIQPSGLTQSAVVIGKKPMLDGTLSYLGRVQGWVRDVTEASPLMRERQKTFQRDILNVVGDLEKGPVTGRWSKFHRDVIIPLSFVLIQKTQFYTVDMPTWVAAYQKELAASGQEDRARIYADSMVRRTQGSGLMSDRGMLERGTWGRNSRQSEFARLFTALGSYMFAKGNVAYERSVQTNFRNPAEAFSWAVDMALLFTFEAVLYAAVKGFLPEEDEDEAVWLARETALSAMSTLPFARDIASMVQGFGGGGTYGSILDTALVRPVNQIGQGDVDRALVGSIVDSAGIFFHLPSAQGRKIIYGFLDEDGDIRSDPDIPTMLGIGGENRVTILDYLSQY